MPRYVYVNRLAADLGDPCIMVDGLACSEARLSGNVRVVYRPQAPVDGASVFVECDHAEIVKRCPCSVAFDLDIDRCAFHA